MIFQFVLLKYRYKVSLLLTNMRYINGWGESIVLRHKAEDFFDDEARRMIGFYIKDKFFKTMPDSYANYD